MLATLKAGRKPLLAFAAALSFVPPSLAQAPGAYFDRSAGAEGCKFLDPQEPPQASELDAFPLSTPVPPELSAARSKVGVEAQLSRLGALEEGSAFRFAVIGDGEPGRFPWERLFSPGPKVYARQLGLAQAEGPAFILQLGDFVSEGRPRNYEDYVSLVEAEASVPLLHAIGNHDRSRPNGDADKDLYDAVFGPRDYYFDHGGWRFVALDSSDRKLTASQLAWLNTVLSTPQPKVIFTHVPPAFLKNETPLREAAAARGTASFEAEPDGYIHDFLTNYFEEGADEFDTLVAGGNVAAVYMGHIHAFFAADHHGTRYVISGGGGSPLYPLPPGYPAERFAHYLTVDVSPDGLLETVHPYGGTPFLLPKVSP